MKFAIKLSAIAATCLLATLQSSMCFARDAKTFFDITMVPQHTLLDGDLPLDVSEAASILKIKPLVERLKTSPTMSGQVESKTNSQMRLLVICRMMAASQEVRRTVASINQDLADSNITLDSLSAKRDALRNTINTINFAQGGILGTLGKGGALAGYPRQSNVKLVTSASIGTGLSVLNLFTPRVWNHKIDTQPNILVHFLKPNFIPKDAAHSYLWAFFNAPIPGSSWTFTRKEILIKHWKDYLGFDATNKISVKRVTASPDGSETISESISTVAQRIALLQDLKAHVEEFDISLNELSKSIETQ